MLQLQLVASHVRMDMFLLCIAQFVNDVTWGSMLLRACVNHVQRGSMRMKKTLLHANRALWVGFQVVTTCRIAVTVLWGLLISTRVLLAVNHVLQENSRTGRVKAVARLVGLEQNLQTAERVVNLVGWGVSITTQVAGLVRLGVTPMWLLRLFAPTAFWAITLHLDPPVVQSAIPDSFGIPAISMFASLAHQEPPPSSHGLVAPSALKGKRAMPLRPRVLFVPKACRRTEAPVHVLHARSTKLL